MDTRTSVNSTPIPPDKVINVSQDTTSIPEENRPKINLSSILIIVFLLVLTPIVALSSLSSKSWFGKAEAPSLRIARVECNSIFRVAINPGKVNTYVNAPQTNMSTLAYDIDNQPIYKGVSYKWGISSNNGIGNLKSKNDLAAFYPLKRGLGDVYVVAQNDCTKKGVTGSVSVTVN